MKWHQYEKPLPVYRQKKLFIPLVIIAFLVVLRVLMTPVILAVANSKLKDFSPTLEGHVDGLSLGIIRGQAVLKDLRFKIKDSSKEFLKVDSIEGAISWGDLFRGDPAADVVVNHADFTYSDDLMKAVKKHQAEAAKGKVKVDKKAEELPVRLARVDLKDSILRLEAFRSLTKEHGVLMDHIDGRITNITPTEEAPKTLATIQGKLLESGTLKTVAEAKLLESPMKWSVDSELLKFNLSDLNEFLMNKVPLTFTKGKLDFYVEAKSEKGRIDGYMKPFVTDLDVVRKEEDFKGPKHFIVEVITAISNLTVRSERDKEAATKVPFSFDGKVKVDAGESLMNAFQHGFTQEISKGIENSINLK